MSATRNNLALALCLLGAAIMLAFASERDHTSRTIVSMSWVPLLLAHVVFLRVIYAGYSAIQRPFSRSPIAAVLLLIVPVINVYGIWSVVGGYAKAFDAYLAETDAEGGERLGGGAFRLFAFLTLIVGPMLYVGSWLGDFRFALRPVAELLTIGALLGAVVDAILLFFVVARICRAVTFARTRHARPRVEAA